MSAHASKKTVYAALGANLVIAVAKFIGSAFTGSSAMMSEGIHSLVDTGNQLLLLYGMKDAARPADHRHPLGYGLRIYFWGFVVSLLVFALGAIVALYEGFHKIQETDHALENVWLNVLILVVSILLEGASLRYAIKGLRDEARERGETMRSTLRNHRDPAVFAVIYEETAALAGLGTALIGICLAVLLDMPILDGVTSIAIGLILAGTSFTMARHCRRLMTGNAANPKIEAYVRDVLSRVRAVEHINEVRTIQYAPMDVNVLISVDVRDDLPSGALENIISDVKDGIADRFDEVRRIWIMPESRSEHVEDLAEIGETTDDLVPDVVNG